MTRQHSLSSAVSALIGLVFVKLNIREDLVNDKYCQRWLGWSLWWSRQAAFYPWGGMFAIPPSCCHQYHNPDDLRHVFWVALPISQFSNICHQNVRFAWTSCGRQQSALSVVTTLSPFRLEMAAVLTGSTSSSIEGSKKHWISSQDEGSL